MWIEVIKNILQYLKERKNMRKEKTFFTMIIFTLLFLMPIAVKAINVPVYGYGYAKGISRVSYWIDYSSGTGFYEYLIINAEHNWENPGWTSPVNMVAASSNAGTMLDIYTKPNSFFTTKDDVIILGLTEYFNNSGSLVYPEDQTYAFTRIHINDDTNHNRNATEVQGTIAHEMGHAFGLAHVNDAVFTNKESIMGESWYRTVQTVQKCDTDALSKLY